MASQATGGLASSNEEAWRPIEARKFNFIIAFQTVKRHETSVLLRYLLPEKRFILDRSASNVGIERRLIPAAE